MSEKINIKILIAPLDWGLGHATRCIPLIYELLKLGCKVIIASEGPQENLLKREFPELVFVTLPGYRVKYSTNKRFFSLKIILQVPLILMAISREKKWLKKFIANTPVDAVISDNRYGLYLRHLPCVIITHQLLIKAPWCFLEKIIQKINYSFLEKFNRCWVPDEKGIVNMAGVLSHPKVLPKVPVEYLGGISRLAMATIAEKKYDLMVIISGPEPQRTILEKKLLGELEGYQGHAIVVRGLPGKEEIKSKKGNITITNHLVAKDMEIVLSKSELIISRSGYTTVMDICKLQKKAVLIPTPGQTEQEYLAKHLHDQGWCLVMQQDSFSLKKMQQQLKDFEYKLPRLDMEFYKKIIGQFVQNLRG